MTDTKWKEGNCTGCGIHQNILFKKDEDDYWHWECIYCGDIHYVNGQTKKEELDIK